MMKTYFAKDIEWTPKGGRAKSPYFYEENLIDYCSKNNYIFNGFVGEWEGNKTKISLFCISCRVSVISTYNRLYDQGKGCKQCGRKRINESNFIDKDELLSKVKDRLIEIGHKFIKMEHNEGSVKSTIIYSLCNEGHENKFKYPSLMRKRTECHCVDCRNIKGSVRKMNIDIAKERIYNKCIEKGYIFNGIVGEWLGADKSTISLTCNKGHRFDISYKRFVCTGNGCQMCAIKKVADKRRLDLDDVNNKFDVLKKYRGITFIEFIDGKYKNNTTKNIKFLCKKGHSFISALINTACPICHQYGGFDKKEIGTLYIQKLTKNDVFMGVKFGITNLATKKRMKQQSNKSKFDHEIFYELTLQDGQKILELENKIKEAMKGKTSYISKEDMPDGWTETVAPSELSTIMYIVKSFEKELTA